MKKYTSTIINNKVFRFEINSIKSNAPQNELADAKESGRAEILRQPGSDPSKVA